MPTANISPTRTRPAPAVTCVLAAFLVLGPTVPGLDAQATGDLRPPVASPDAPCPPPPEGIPRARGVIEGTVRDERTGRPLPDSRLLVSLPGREQNVGQSLTFRTDGRGRFRLCRLPAGWTVHLRVERESLIGAPEQVWVRGDSAVRRDLTIFLGEPGAVSGRVRDRESGDAVAGATVSLPSLGAGAVTGDAGQFRIEAVPAGRYGLEVEHVAYGLSRDSVGVSGGNASRLDIRLSQRPLPVAPLTVIVEDERPIWLERTGFFRRRNRGSGIHFTREEIIAEGHSRLSEVFRGLSGIRIRDGRVTMSRAPKSLLSGGRACPLQHFIDGQAVSLPMGVDTYLPEDVAAVEVYRGPAEVPMAFNQRRAACGAVVLWLRARRD